MSDRIHVRHTLLSLALAGSLLPGSTAHAQQPTPPAAPLPAVLAHTQSIFLANAGDQENADCLRAYNLFYAGLDALHRFTFVQDPAQADLIVELHYEIDLGASVVADGGRSGARQFRTALIEPHTHTLVWSLTERANYASLRRNRDKDLDAAVDALVNDFATLVAPTPTVPTTPSRSKHGIHF